MTAQERLTEQLDAALANYTAGIDRAVRFVTIDQVDMLAEFYLQTRRAALAAVRSEQARVLAMRDAGYDTPSLDPRDEVITALEWYAEDSSSQGDMARAALAAAKAVLK